MADLAMTHLYSLLADLQVETHGSRRGGYALPTSTAMSLVYLHPLLPSETTVARNRREAQELPTSADFMTPGKNELSPPPSTCLSTLFLPDTHKEAGTPVSPGHHSSQEAPCLSLPFLLLSLPRHMDSTIPRVSTSVEQKKHSPGCGSGRRGPNSAFFT